MELKFWRKFESLKVIFKVHMFLAATYGDMLLYKIL